MRGVVPSMLLWAAGCGDGKWPLGTPGSDSADTGAASAEAGPLGFIGAPCETDDDCLYDGGMCLTDELGFPEGSCSLPCEQYCPDDDDAPVTYCVSSDELPDATAALMDAGACASRCDFSIFPWTGCREGYGCAETERPSGSDHNFAWHDMMLRVESDELAHLLGLDFAGSWSGRPVAWDAEVEDLRVISASGHRNRHAFAPVVDAIRSAESSIDVVSAYVSHPFTRYLADAASRGVHVRVLTPAENNKSNLARHIIER